MKLGLLRKRIEDDTVWHRSERCSVADASDAWHQVFPQGSGGSVPPTALRLREELGNTAALREGLRQEHRPAEGGQSLSSPGLGNHRALNLMASSFVALY